MMLETPRNHVASSELQSYTISTTNPINAAHMLQSQDLLFAVPFDNL